MLVPDPQGRLKSIQILRVENRRQRRPVHRPSAFIASPVMLAVSGTCFTQTTQS